MQAVPWTAKVDMEFTIGGQEITTGYHIRDFTGWDEAKLQTATLGARALWIALSPYFPTNVVLTKVTATDLSTMPQTQYVNNDPPITGDDPVGVASLNVSPVLTLRTANIGKSYRGRMYLPPCAENDVDAAYLTESFRNGVVGAMQTHIDGLASAGTPLVVVSRYQFKVELPIPITTPITTCDFASNKVGTQRRRLGRR